jgi:mono/diheme cytochrome c family protein
MFTQYCAPCHGVDGAGNGPAASAMTQPTNLTQLGKKHDGKYPDSMVPQRISNTVTYIATLPAK